MHAGCRWSFGAVHGLRPARQISVRPSVNTTSYTGNMTGSPAEDWWDGCMWRTENVSITRNTIDFNPAKIMDCNRTAWPACGAGGIFSEYGSPPDKEPGWVIPTQLMFFQNNTWSDNIYNGPSTFFVWNQGNGDNPVSWGDWTGTRPGRQVRYGLRAAKRLLHRSVWPGCWQHLPQHPASAIRLTRTHPNPRCRAAR